MKGIDKFRFVHLSIAELLDSWRIIPRLLAGAYCYLLYKLFMWYTSLAPYIMDGCTQELIEKCIVDAPTTQHTALITAAVGISGAIFGLYTGTGRKWTEGVKRWIKSEEPKKEDPSDSEK